MEFILDEANGNGDRVATSAYGPEGFVSLNLDGAGVRQLWHQLGLALVKLDEDEKARMKQERDESPWGTVEAQPPAAEGMDLPQAASEDDVVSDEDVAGPSPNEIQAAAQGHTPF